MPRKAGKNDEARGRSRAALLQAGADLIVDDALSNPFAALRLRRLCARAGLSTGAFYVHWATLGEYYDDLARHLTEAEELAFGADFAALTSLAREVACDSPADAIARVADADLQSLVTNPMWDAMELVSLTWGRAGFRDKLAAGYRTLDRQTGQLYATVLATCGRQPRPPLTWDSIGTILQGLAEGMGLRHKVDPASVSASAPAASGPYATAVAAILAVLTTPGTDHASAPDTIRAMLDETAPGG